MVSPSDPTPDVVWFVGELLPSEHPSGHTWQLLAVFDTETAARVACTTGNHFCAPLEMNRLLEGPVQEWPGMVFPNRGADSVDNENYMDS
jgi:hypothetical protein